jgi:hypothetical protein
MRRRVRSALLGILSGATALSSLPPEALAGPMSVAAPTTVSLNAPTDTVHYRRYYRPARWGYYRGARWGYYRPAARWGYYRGYYPRRYGYYPYRRYYPAYRYGYDPAGALFAGAALGLVGAGLAAATAPRWGWGWGGGWGGPWGGWGWGGPFGFGGFGRFGGFGPFWW